MRHRSGKASEAAGTLTGPIFSGMMPPIPLGIADAPMFSQCPYNTAATKGLAGRFLNMPSPVFGGHDSRDICPLIHHWRPAPCAIPPHRPPSPVHSPLWRAVWTTYFASAPSACRRRSRYRTGKASPPGRRALKGRALWRTLSQQSAFQATLLSRGRTPFARPLLPSLVFLSLKKSSVIVCGCFISTVR